jgi:hypothetical protein
MATAKLELLKIYTEQGGKLTPEKVLEVASGSVHPLHSYFEWDDTTAAIEYRLSQARSLIKSIKVNVVTPADQLIEVRAYVSLPSDRVKGDGYRHITDVLNSTQLRAELISDIRRTADEWSKKASLFGAVLDVQKINELIEGV